MTVRSPRKSLDDLLAVMAALRTPETGCPWDLAQDFHTIAPYTIEEACEVADAIVRGDMADLKDELGDLLFQVVYHSRIAEERRAFSFADVVQAITEKMLRRHPHVFGSEEDRAQGAVEGFWERIKAEEKAAAAARSEVRSRAPQGLLDAVPATFPALTRAVKLQDKAAKAGFDWPSLAPVFAKLKEELAELENALNAGSRPAIEEEFGDLLFVLTNLARHLKIDPEASLRAANGKFVRRFRHIEARLAEAGKRPQDSTLEEMDRLWDEAKALERAGPPAETPGT